MRELNVIEITPCQHNMGGLVSQPVARTTRTTNTLTPTNVAAIGSSVAVNVIPFRTNASSLFATWNQLSLLLQLSPAFHQLASDVINIIAQVTRSNFFPTLYQTIHYTSLNCIVCVWFTCNSHRWSDITGQSTIMDCITPFSCSRSFINACHLHSSSHNRSIMDSSCPSTSCQQYPISYRSCTTIIIDINSR
jgi:hypothetical protein